MEKTEGGGSHTEMRIEADAFVPLTKEKKAPVPVKLPRMRIFKRWATSTFGGPQTQRGSVTFSPAWSAARPNDPL